MEMILLFLVFAGTIFYVAQPLFGKPIPLSSDIESEIESLNIQKLDIYSQIKQFDMEFELDLLNEEDYYNSRNKLKAEASAIIDRIKSLKAGD